VVERLEEERAVERKVVERVEDIVNELDVCLILYFIYFMQ